MDAGLVIDNDMVRIYEGGDGVHSLLLDRSHQSLLLLGKFLLNALLKGLDALLDLGEFFLLALADGGSPGADFLLIGLVLGLEFLDHCFVGLLCLLAGCLDGGAGLVRFRHELNKFGEVDVRELGLRHCSDAHKSRRCDH